MNFENWEVEGDSAVNGFTDRRDSDVKIAGEDASLRQEITGLVPGENYTISVWTDVRGDMTSLLTVRVGDRTLDRPMWGTPPSLSVRSAIISTDIPPMSSCASTLPFRRM